MSDTSANNTSASEQQAAEPTPSDPQGEIARLSAEVDRLGLLLDDERRARLHAVAAEQKAMMVGGALWRAEHEKAQSYEKDIEYIWGNRIPRAARRAERDPVFRVFFLAGVLQEDTPIFVPPCDLLPEEIAKRLRDVAHEMGIHLHPTPSPENTHRIFRVGPLDPGAASTWAFSGGAWSMKEAG